MKKSRSLLICLLLATTSLIITMFSSSCCFVPFVMTHDPEGQPVDFDIPYHNILTGEMAWKIVKNFDACPKGGRQYLEYTDTIDKCDSHQKKYNFAIDCKYSYDYERWVQPKGMRGYNVAR